MAEPICDIVLLTWNHLELVQPCIETLLRHTTLPARLLIIDNGSDLPAHEYLQRVTGTPHVTVELLRNETNEGFRKGMNKGLRVSRAPSVCLLNNDTLVTPGWLERMLEVADANPTIGLLNPSSNVFGDRPCRGETLEAHASHLASRRDEWVEVGSCIGFCLMIKRTVIERIGLLTEDEPGFFFEDDDYSRRAQAAGFFCVVVPSAYVYHAEHRSVRALPQRERVFRASREAYWRRWGRPLRVAYIPAGPVALGSPTLREVLDLAVSWVRRGSTVHLYANGANGASRDQLFRSVGLVPHGDVVFRPCASRAHTLWRTLKRQKKRFALILTTDDTLKTWLSAWRWAHRAVVIDPRETEQLEQGWQARSRFPS